MVFDPESDPIRQDELDSVKLRRRQKRMKTQIERLLAHQLVTVQKRRSELVEFINALQVWTTPTLVFVEQLVAPTSTNHIIRT